MRIIRKQYNEHFNTQVYERIARSKIPGIPIIVSISGNGNTSIVEEELVEGLNLDQILRTRGLYQTKDAIQVILDLCSIVRKLHKLGIVHNDIKPDNMMLTPAGKVYLIDFDAATFIKHEKKSNMIGTPGFAAPEQYGYSRSDERTDIYAIGMLLNIMITGQLADITVAKGSISKIIRKCTAIDAEDRYQTVSMLVSDLKFMKRHKRMPFKYLPPGFRTLSPWKMIVASFVYFLSFYTVIEMKIDAQDGGNLFDLIYLKCFFAIFFFGNIAIFANYHNINDLIKFTRKNKFLQLVSKVLQSVILFATLSSVSIFIWAIYNLFV